MRTKSCTRCKKVKPVSAFGVDRSQPSGLRIYCRQCVAEKKKTPEALAKSLEAVRRYERTERGKQAKKRYRESRGWFKAYIRRAYGLEYADYEKLLAEQQGRCGICRQPFDKTPHIDHHHASGKVRGLLCGKCNRALGVLEQKEFFKAAMVYLTTHGTNPDL